MKTKGQKERRGSVNAERRALARHDAGRAEARPYVRIAMIASGIALVFSIVGWWFFRTPAVTLARDASQNVLLITIDTLRADVLGSYGGRATTPNLDRLAARGRRFAFAHAHAVVTLASHASILTGRYPYEHGIRDNTGYRFPADMPTLATRLKSAGFATGAFIGGFPLDHRFGLNVGFDVYDDQLAASSATETNERERRADAVVRSAGEWIGAQRGKWFAWTHVYDPHAPYAAPPEYAARYPADPYLAEVSWTDAALGVLLDRLDAQPTPTLVIVTADHGEGLGEHGELTHSVFAYEATLRVPLIVARVGVGAPRPATSAAPIESAARHVDIVPTVIEATGIAAGAPTSGTSLVAAFNGAREADRPSYFEAMTSAVTRGWAPLRGVVAGREKYIDLPLAERYELSTDPAEQRNVFAAAADRAQMLINTLKGFNVAPPGKPREENAETIERLRSLGYVGGGMTTSRETFTEADDPKKLIELEQIMQRAADAAGAGRLADAANLYDLVIARRSDMEDAYRKLALLYWRSGRAAEAIATLERALKNGVTQKEVRIKLGQYLAESGQATRAIDLLTTFAGDDPDALVGLGNAYVQAGKPADAIQTFTKLLAVDPGNGLAHENIGTVHLQAGNLAAAEASLTKALSLDPNLPAAHTALGVVFARTGRRDLAIDEWKRAVALDAFEFDALYNLITNLVAAGRTSEARPYADQYLSTAPKMLSKESDEIRKLIRSA